MALADARADAGLATWIVNADSMQVYTDIPVLSAAPSEEEQTQYTTLSVDFINC